MMTKALRVLSGLVFFLIILGGITRILDAGLSCPDWPLCHGQFIPPMDVQIFAEWFHRLIAALVGLTTVGIGLTVFVSPKHRAKLLGWMPLLLVTLALQVWLGQATVAGQLAPWTVTVHLLTGYTFFTGIVMMALRSSEKRTPRGFNTFGWMSFALVLMALTQVVLGGLVSSNNAGLACPDFPTCMGLWLPPLNGPVLLQFAHRVGALFIFVLSLVLIFKLKRSGLSKFGRRAYMVAGHLLLLQILFGVGLIHSQLASALRIGHVLMALGFYASLLVTVYESWYHD